MAEIAQQSLSPDTYSTAGMPQPNDSDPAEELPQSVNRNEVFATAQQYLQHSEARQRHHSPLPEYLHAPHTLHNKGSSSSLSSFERDEEASHSREPSTGDIGSEGLASQKLAWESYPAFSNHTFPTHGYNFIQHADANSYDNEATDNTDSPDGSTEQRYAVYDPLQVKHRRRTTAPQLKILEAQFAVNPKPEIPVRKQLAEQLSMTPREVQVWFQNRRAKVKRLDKRAASASILTARRASTSSAPQSVQEAQAAGVREAQNQWLAADPTFKQTTYQSSDLPISLSPTDSQAFSYQMSPTENSLPTQHRHPIYAGATGSVLSGASPKAPWPQSDLIARRGSATAENMPYYTPQISSSSSQPQRAKYQSSPSRLSIPDHFDPEQSVLSAPDVARFGQQFVPASASLYQRRQDVSAEPPLQPSEFKKFLALSRQQAASLNNPSELSSSSTSCQSFQFGGSSAPASESTVTTPTSIMSSMSSCLNDAYLGIDQQPSFPPGFDPDTRRSSCPAEFVNSFSQMGFPRIQPQTQGHMQNLQPPNWQTGMPATLIDHMQHQRQLSTPGYWQYDQSAIPADSRRASIAASFAMSPAPQSYPSIPVSQASGINYHNPTSGPTFAQQAMTVSPAVLSMPPNLSGSNADYQRSMSMSLEPIAETPLMHQPQPNAPAPYFLLQNQIQERPQDAEEDNFIPSIASRPGLARKARSHTSIQGLSGFTPERMTSS